MSKPEDRPSASELLARARGGGLECPDCGCRDFRVTNTWWRADGTIGRQRRCRHCGFPIGSDETFQLGPRRKKRADPVPADPAPITIPPAPPPETLPPELAMETFEDAPPLLGSDEEREP